MQSNNIISWPSYFRKFAFIPLLFVICLHDIDTQSFTIHLTCLSSFAEISRNYIKLRVKQIPCFRKAAA